ncbi:biosynthetic peptidoglycan transglycosylase [Vibrio mytili]|nr:biosynthetic peptidoglycan transglycosylase [Vibrio mytili]
MIFRQDWIMLQREVDLRVIEVYEGLPEILFEMLVTGEDHRFWCHNGFDSIGLTRAVWQTIAIGSRQGGSTVAMQLVRTLTGDYEATALRKLKEIYLAVRLTKYLGRHKILKLYLSVAYFGWNMHGANAACKKLNLSLESLSDEQAASIIARLKYPEPKYKSIRKEELINDRALYIVAKSIRLRKKKYMKSFSVPEPLRHVLGTYPNAEEIKEAAKGGDSAKHAIARQWLSEGIPYAFKDCPGVYESLRTWIAMRLDIDPKDVNLTGSARLGQSLAPSKLGKQFDSTSDLDIFIVSPNLFGNLKNDFFSWSDDVDSGYIKPSNDRQSRFWSDNLSRCPKTIARGFIDVHMIPNLNQYDTAQRIAQTLYLMTEKLAVTKGAPPIKKASIRCYESWESYVRQVSLSL